MVESTHHLTYCLECKSKFANLLSNIILDYVITGYHPIWTQCFCRSQFSFKIRPPILYVCLHATCTISLMIFSCHISELPALKGTNTVHAFRALPTHQHAENANASDKQISLTSFSDLLVFLEGLQGQLP